MIGSELSDYLPDFLLPAPFKIKTRRNPKPICNLQYDYISKACQTYMIHKIKYFEADKLAPGVFLQDVVNDFLAEKGDKIIAIHPVMERSVLVHYKEDF